MATPDKYQPGFILPAIPALQVPDSLVMPPGGFRSERIMETWTPIATRRFKLKDLIERGADFERAGCIEIA
jgi:hypothetical protein